MQASTVADLSRAIHRRDDLACEVWRPHAAYRVSDLAALSRLLGRSDG
jgi:hypothetical protein